ncbi:PilX N-terminal domain-containing pilus assembly protein [Desulfobulbus sp.]|uniref:PilX N-terminal domain-containing pilus assembly protein n=1 Tax=Desulfobulbus sp. TaxID=895 RepID=UPI00286F8DE8|nr:PilX N-terminal domain-containing pilus assembly protein [Desulfobulbus sp.]
MQQNTTLSATTNNEKGFVLVGALLILTLLVLIGVSATTSSMLELQVSGAERIHSETFFQADSGIQVAVRLIEENLAVTSGFTSFSSSDILKDPDAVANNTIVIATKTLSSNGDDRMPTNTDRDIGYYPNGFDPVTATTDLRTNITVSGFTDSVEGFSMGMGMGYEGTGRRESGKIVYTIHSQHIGKSQSETNIEARWRHMIGLELEGRL